MKGLVEHVSEVKTSKLGAILLTLMVIFIFSISQNFLNDISYIIKKPLNPSVCVLQLATQSKEDLIVTMPRNQRGETVLGITKKSLSL